MKKILLFLVFICSIECFSQITFHKTLGRAIFYSVKQTLDGGYIVTGRTYGTAFSDVLVIKTDSIANVQWSRTYGGANNDIGHSVQQTSDGGFIIAGETGSFGAGGQDVYLVRTNANGDTLWTKTYGGTGHDIGKSVLETSDGGFVVAGRTNSYGTGLYDVYMIKLDTSGTILWTKTFGGASNDYGYSVEHTTEGGFIVSGDKTSFGGPSDIYLIKTNGSGDTIWTKWYDGGWYTSEGNSSIQKTKGGGYIIAGTTEFGVGLANFYLLRVDANGDTLWTRYNEGVNWVDKGYSVQQTSDAGFVIAGSTENINPGQDDFEALYLVKTDSSGNVLWSKAYGYSALSAGYCIEETTDGGLIIAGYKIDFGYYTGYLIKTNANGESGCWDNTGNTITGYPTPTISSTPTITGSGGIVGSPATIVGNITISDSIICISTYLADTNIDIEASENYPNPFNKNTTIQYTIQNTQKVTLTVYNIHGQIVSKLLDNKIQKPGIYQISYDVPDLPAGIYFYTLQIGDIKKVQKMIKIM